MTLLKFETYEEFWNYCHNVCSNRRTGCANGCAYRVKLKIPPHGGTYPKKGKIAEELWK